MTGPDSRPPAVWRVTTFPDEPTVLRFLTLLTDRIGHHVEAFERRGAEIYADHFRARDLAVRLVAQLGKEGRL